ncbi:MAG: iron transporter [Betaproteobacteria bacterium]|nr:iron transporter [Betaproteobacteria bacterium]
MNAKLQMTLLAALIAAPVFAQAAEPKVKVLAAAEDPTQKTVLVGHNAADNMIVIFEIEAAKAMWMRMGNPPKWTEHAPGKGEVYHVEVKPVDPGSKTRISYAEVKFSAVNRDNKKKVSTTLPPMWGGSGLHYAANSALAGDGAYDATVTVGVPGFGRDAKNKDLWMKPVTTRFHFKLSGGKLVEVTEPVPEPQK